MTKTPIILCCGQNGRAVIYGYVTKLPTPGEPVELIDAKMVLYWAGQSGLLGLAAKGPHKGSNITHAVPRVVETVWQEWVEVAPAAAEIIDGWEPA